MAEPGAWASLVALRQRRHALVKQRHTKLEISCGALSEGRWQHDAGSAVTLEHELRPGLLTSVPTELSPGRPGFIILDDLGSLDQFDVDEDCQLHEVGDAQLPSMALMRADWWMSAQGHPAHLCLTGFGAIALPTVTCTSWPLASEPAFRRLGTGISSFLDLDLVAVATVNGDDAGLSLARIGWDLDEHALMLRDAGMQRSETLSMFMAGVALPDGSVIVLGGDESARLVALEFRAGASPRELPLPEVPGGSLAGLASLGLEGRPGFVVASAGDEMVHLTVLGVR